MPLLIATMSLGSYNTDYEVVNGRKRNYRCSNVPYKVHEPLSSSSCADEPPKKKHRMATRLDTRTLATRTLVPQPYMEMIHYPLFLYEAGMMEGRTDWFHNNRAYFDRFPQIKKNLTIYLGEVGLLHDYSFHDYDFDHIPDTPRDATQTLMRFFFSGKHTKTAGGLPNKKGLLTLRATLAQFEGMGDTCTAEHQLKKGYDVTPDSRYAKFFNFTDEGRAVKHTLFMLFFGLLKKSYQVRQQYIDADASKQGDDGGSMTYMKDLATQIITYKTTPSICANLFYIAFHPKNNITSLRQLADLVVREANVDGGGKMTTLEKIEYIQPMLMRAFRHAMYQMSHTQSTVSRLFFAAIDSLNTPAEVKEDIPGCDVDKDRFTNHLLALTKEEPYIEDPRDRKWNAAVMPTGTVSVIRTPPCQIYDMEAESRDPLHEEKGIKVTTLHADTQVSKHGHKLCCVRRPWEKAEMKRWAKNSHWTTDLERQGAHYLVKGREIDQRQPQYHKEKKPQELPQDPAQQEQLDTLFDNYQCVDAIDLHYSRQVMRNVFEMAMFGCLSEKHDDEACEDWYRMHKTMHAHALDRVMKTEDFDNFADEVYNTAYVSTNLNQKRAWDPDTRSSLRSILHNIKFDQECLKFASH